MNLQIPAEKRLAEIDVFDLNLDIVHLTLGLLGPVEPAARAQERRG